MDFGMSAQMYIFQINFKILSFSKNVDASCYSFYKKNVYRS